MWAILSDIHSNWTAFEAVLKDAEDCGADRILILGDVIGYGPDPIECIDLARKSADLILLGNFERALAADDFDGWSAQLAVRSVVWTRTVLGLERLEFLGGLPQTYAERDCLFVHGSPRNPVHEYVFPEDVYNSRKMRAIFSLAPRIAFCGHTHVPGVMLRNHDDQYDWIAPVDQPTVELHAEQQIVNVGSVGQPRDGDSRACYVLLHANQVTYRRVEYEIEATVRRIQANPELDDFLAERLREGR